MRRLTRAAHRGISILRTAFRNRITFAEAKAIHDGRVKWLGVGMLEFNSSPIYPSAMRRERK